MSEKRKFSLEEIKQVATELKGILEFFGEHSEEVAIRKWATDLAGTYIARAFKLGSDGLYEEIDVNLEIDKMSTRLAKSISSKRIIKEILQKCAFHDLVDLGERLQSRTVKVTAGVQKGSCVYLYISGKRGAKTQLQLTE